MGLLPSASFFASAVAYAHPPPDRHPQRSSFKLGAVVPRPAVTDSPTPRIPESLAADVFARAARLHLEQQDQPGGYSIDDLLQAGREAQIPAEYIYQALHQVRPAAPPTRPWNRPWIVALVTASLSVSGLGLTYAALRVLVPDAADSTTVLVSAPSKNLDRLTQRRKCVGCNLAGADLAGRDLKGVNLRGANLSGANLRGANLASANLQGTNLAGANLEQTNLSAAQLGGADLKGANLYAAQLNLAKLQGARLDAAHLEGADLTGADLRAARLVGVDLRATKLDHANLQEAVGLALPVQ
ncbi:MAG: pentapeptide repeat-containing protein [Gloeomargaritaceae cyanobacterium C42_A2020_066]|nr:pentapeptide repeat-containing protein [Gloeomargaritaceae cyanobacterium C42_A2020_066]